MSAVDRLFLIQAKLKKSIVNRERKIAEVKQLRLSFEDQIKSYLFSLYSSSVYLWSLSNTDRCDLPLKTIFAKQNISNEIGSKRITTKIIELRNSQTFFEEMEDGPLTMNQFLLVLSMYNFCWSSESMEMFLDKLSTASEKCVEKFSLCLLVNPLTQVYIRTALRKTIKQSCQDVINALLEYAPLCPSFLKRLLKMHSKMNLLFFQGFVKPVIMNCAMFNLADPEFMLYKQDDLDTLITELETYFSTSESMELVEKIVAAKEISVIPLEVKLADIHPKYHPVTIVDGDSYDFGEFTALSYVMLSSITDTLTRIRDPIPGNTLTGICKRFLLRAELVRLEKDYETAIEYFQQIASLSSVYGDPELEVELDELDSRLSLTPGCSIEDIIEMIENDMKQEEESSLEDPLIEISGYSRQFSYLNRLKDIVDSVAVNAKIYIEFLSKQDHLAKNPIDKGIPFTQQYAQICTDIDASVHANREYVSYRTMFSLLSREYGLQLELTDKDREVHKFLTDHKQDLIDYHQLEFLEPFKENPEKLQIFFNEINEGFMTNMPFARIEHIHSAYQVLTGLLQMHGMNEIGADQLVPFAIIAIVYANPMGLASTHEFLSMYVEPVMAKSSPIDHPQEYSVIQFMSSYQFLNDRMNGKEDVQ